MNTFRIQACMNSVLQNEKVLLTVVLVQSILSKLLQALSVNGKIAGWNCDKTAQALPWRKEKELQELLEHFSIYIWVFLFLV